MLNSGHLMFTKFPERILTIATQCYSLRTGNQGAEPQLTEIFLKEEVGEDRDDPEMTSF